MSWMAIYGYALAIAFVPAILYLGSMHGYIDGNFRSISVIRCMNTPRMDHEKL